MKRMRSILAALLSLVMIALCVPVASAQGGTDGGITWNYNADTKTLTFSGSGSIPDYANPDNRPWRVAKECQTVKIQYGVTGIGTNAFCYFYSLQSITIADSMTTIGNSAFDTVTKNVALTAKFEKDAEQKPPKVIIRNFTASSRTYDYRSSIEFAATVDNPIYGGQIRWYVDDEYVRTGDTYTAENVKQSFSLQAKYYADGKEIPEAATEVEKVNVNAGFFARLKAFVRVLFRKLPVVVQEYLGAEIIDRILP